MSESIDLCLKHTRKKQLYTNVVSIFNNAEQLRRVSLPRPTNGIYANMVARFSGRSLRYCLGTYLRLKDEIFNELMPPYDPERLEALLREVFGETTTMSDVDRWPRVAVTTVMADRWPAELHLFRNYQGPEEILGGDDIDPKLKWSSKMIPDYC